MNRHVWLGLNPQEKKVGIKFWRSQFDLNSEEAISLGQSICFVAIMLRKIVLGERLDSEVRIPGLPEVLSNGATINKETLDLLLRQFSYQRCAEILGVSELELTEISIRLRRFEQSDLKHIDNN